MRSPLRVLSWRHAATMPPMLVSGSIGLRPPGPQASPRGAGVGASASSADRPRAELLQVARRSDRPGGRSSTGRAFPSRTRAARISVHGGAVGQATAAGAAPSPSSSPPPKSSRLALVAVALQPRAVLARRVDGGQQPRPQLRGRQAARRRCRCASESNAPALTRLSNTRLLTRRRSRSSQSACERRDAPLLASRTSSSDSIAPSPTFLIAVRPKRTPSRRRP